MNIPERRRPILAAAAVVVLLASGAATACAPAPDRKLVALTLDDAPTTVEGDSTMITGRTTPGARVEVAGQTAIVEGDRFEHSVAVEVGENRILVVATKNGLEVARDEVTVRRAKPEAQVAEEPEAPTPPQTPPGGHDHEEVFPMVPRDGVGPTSCPPGEVMDSNQGVRNCVSPVASPEDCGPGYVPIPDPPGGSPGSCQRE